MTPVPIDLAAKLATFSEPWSPRVVAEMNDYGPLTARGDLWA